MAFIRFDCMAQDQCPVCCTKAHINESSVESYTKSMIVAGFNAKPLTTSP